METRQKFAYSRLIKLAPAIGDWTTIQYRDPDLDEVHISPVYSISFDSLSKDKLKYVHYLHYRLAESMAKTFSQDMDINVAVHSIAATQMSYDDFVRSQDTKVVQVNMYLEEYGKMNVILDWGLADCMVNRLMGGKGVETQLKQFSPLEIGIIQPQIEQLPALLSKAWKPLIQPQSIKLEYVFGPYVQDKRNSMRDGYVVFVMYVYFGKSDLKKITIAYPSDVIRKILQQKQQQLDSIKIRVGLESKTLMGVKVPVKAVLGKAVLTMKELKHLQEGDIIPLEASVETPVEVSMGEKTKFLAQPGVSHNRLCVQLISTDLPTQPIAVQAPATSAESYASTAASAAFAAAAMSSVIPNEPEPVAEPEPEDGMDSFSSWGQTEDVEPVQDVEQEPELEQEAETEESNWDTESIETEDSSEPTEESEEDQEPNEESESYHEDAWQIPDFSTSTEESTEQVSNAEDQFSWDDLDDKF